MPGFIHTLVIERPFGTDLDSNLDPDTDDYGQPILEYDTAFADVAGLIQPKTAREQDLTTGGGAEVGDHTIYMLRRDITTRDRLLDTTPGGSGARYEILGIRDHNFGALAHMAIDAKRVTSPALELGS